VSDGSITGVRLIRDFHPPGFLNTSSNFKNFSIFTIQGAHVRPHTWHCLSHEVLFISLRYYFLHSGTDMHRSRYPNPQPDKLIYVPS
jgi:hypothetical protein